MEISKWSQQSTLLNVQATSLHYYEDAVINAPVEELLIADAPLVASAILLVAVYTLFVLGSCSPIHFRAASTGTGTVCLLLSITSGYGVAFATGNLISRAHNILPFMVLGIGVDDLYVIVNGID